MFLAANNELRKRSGALGLGLGELRALLPTQVLNPYPHALSPFAAARGALQHPYVWWLTASAPQIL